MLYTSRLSVSLVELFIASLSQVRVDGRWSKFISKGNFFNYSRFKILRLIFGAYHWSSKTVPNLNPVIKMWHNESIINNYLNGSFFWNKRSHPFGSTYSWGYLPVYFFKAFAPGQLSICGDTQGFGMSDFLDDLNVNSYFNVFILDS